MSDGASFLKKIITNIKITTVDQKYSVAASDIEEFRNKKLKDQQNSLLFDIPYLCLSCSFVHSQSKKSISGTLQGVITVLLSKTEEIQKPRLMQTDCWSCTQYLLCDLMLTPGHNITTSICISTVKGSSICGHRKLLKELSLLQLL